MANAHQAAGAPVEKISLLRVLGPAHVWALGVGIVLVGEYMGWNFAVGKGGAYAALIACWFAGLLYTCVAMIETAIPVVNPLVTGHGINLMRVPMRARPIKTRITPAIRVAKTKPP